MCGMASWNYRPALYTTIKDTNSTWVGRLIQVLWGTVMPINWWCAVMCSDVRFSGTPYFVYTSQKSEWHTEANKLLSNNGFNSRCSDHKTIKLCYHINWQQITNLSVNMRFLPITHLIPIHRSWAISAVPRPHTMPSAHIPTPWLGLCWIIELFE